MKAKVEMQFLNDSHPLQHGFTLTQTVFPTTGRDFSFIFSWGINPKPNLSKKDELTANKYGKATFNPLDLSIEDHQQFLYNICIELSNLTNLVDLSISNSIVCPIKLLKDYALLNGTTFPIPSNLFNQTLNGFKDYLSYSLGINETESSRGSSSKDLIGFSYQTNELLYIAMKATMYLPPKLETLYLKPLYNQVKEYEQSILNKAPIGLKNGFTTSFSWITLVTQENIVSSTINGIISSMLFSLLVAFLSNFNLIYTLYFFYSLASIVLSIIGILQILGWGIGLNEAVMLTIASGFCTDYIVHTMLSMSLNKKNSIFGKLQNSITTFSTPITFAFLTTIGSAIFLYPSNIIIFPPFATFLIMSAIFGMIHGFIVLPSLASIF